MRQSLKVTMVVKVGRTLPSLCPRDRGKRTSDSEILTAWWAMSVNQVFDSNYFTTSIDTGTSYKDLLTSYSLLTLPT